MKTANLIIKIKSIIEKWGDDSNVRVYETDAVITVTKRKFYSLELLMIQKALKEQGRTFYLSACLDQCELNISK